MNNTRVWFFIAFSIALFFLQNTFVPFFSDDIGWIGSLSSSDFYGCIKDFFADQKNMWLTQNGRAVNHAIWQLTICGGELCYDIFISLVFCGVILLLGNLFLSKHGRSALLPWAFIAIALLYLSPDHSTNFYWAGGGCHYLWPCLLALVFLWILDQTRTRRYSVYTFLPLLLFSFLSGWTHEIFALPISFSLFVFIVYCVLKGRATEINAQQWTLIIAYWLGAIMIVISPGTISRIGGTVGGTDVSMLQSLVAKLVTSFKIFRYGRCFYIVIALFLYLMIVRREFFKKFAKDNAFIILSFLGSLGIVVILGVGGRAIWGVEVFSLILVLKWLDKQIDIATQYKRYSFVGSIVASIILLHQVLLLKPFSDAWSSYNNMVAQTKVPGFNGTAIMEDWHSDKWWIDPFVAHPYDMMMQDMWMRIPLHTNVCRSDQYKQLKESQLWDNPNQAENVGGDFYIPYSEEIEQKIQSGEFIMDLAPMSYQQSGSWLYLSWHMLLQKVWPERYPSVISSIYPGEYCKIQVGDKSFIRFDKPVRPVYRQISSVKIKE